MQLAWHGGWPRPSGHAPTTRRRVGESCPQIVVVVLVFGWGVDRLPPWTRTPIRPATRPGPGRAGSAGGRAPGPGRPGPSTGWLTAPWPSGCSRCGGWWTAWKATGSPNSPPWTPAAPPAPNTACQVGSTAAWLRHRLRMSAGTAAGLVRTARALYRGPLTATAQALADGELSAAHAQVLAHGTHDLPDHVAVEAEPVLVEAARRLDPPRLRRVRCPSAAGRRPRRATDQAERRHQQRGLWLASTWEGMVAVNGLLDPEAGQTLLAALEPLARPANATDARSASPAPRRCPHRAGPPHPGSRPAPPDRWGPAPAAGDRGPGQPPRPPRRRWAGTLVGQDPWTPRPVGGWPATARSPGSWSPATPATTTTPATATTSLAARLQAAATTAPPDPWRRPDPAAGGRPHQPSRDPRPTRRPGRPRRRLRGPRLRPTPSLVRSPPSPPLAPWRPHRPRPTSPCSAEPIIARSTRAAGGLPATPTAG